MAVLVPEAEQRQVRGRSGAGQGQDDGVEGRDFRGGAGGNGRTGGAEFRRQDQPDGSRRIGEIADDQPGFLRIEAHEGEMPLRIEPRGVFIAIGQVPGPPFGESRALRECRQIDTAYTTPSVHGSESVRLSVHGRV